MSDNEMKDRREAEMFIGLLYYAQPVELRSILLRTCYSSLPQGAR